MAYFGTQSADLEKDSTQSFSITDASQTGLGITGDLTFEAWIKQESLASAGNNRVVFAKKTTGGVDDGYQLMISSSNDKMIFTIGDDSSNSSSFECDTAFVSGDVGKWIHIAAVLDVSTPSVVFYINGVAQSTTTNSSAATAIGSNTEAFGIGAKPGGSTSNLFDGRIANVRIWDVIRTQSEIQDNACLALGATTNLQGEWAFNNALTDNSGNGNTLTNNNTATFVTDAPTFCLIDSDYSDATKSLDLEEGSSQYASIADASQTGLAIAGDITIEGWFKLESPGIGQRLVGKTKTNQYGYSFYLNSSNKLQFYYKDSSANKTRIELDAALSGSQLTDWVHLAVAVDVSAETASFTINGVDGGSTTLAQTGATSIDNTGGDFAIGVRPDTLTAYFDGKTGLVRVWDTIRTTSEISANMCKVLGSTTNLQGQWIFNDTYLDASANGNTLTPSGSPVFATDVPSVCTSTDITETPGSQNVTASLPGSSIITDQSLDINTQEGTFSSQSPTATGQAIITPDAQNGTFSTPPANVLTPDAFITPSTQTANFTVPTATPAISKIVSVDPQEVTASLPVSEVVIGQEIIPDEQNLIATIPAYSIQFPIILEPGVQVMTASIPAYAVGIGMTIYAEPQNLIATTLTQSIFLDYALTPSPVVGLFEIEEVLVRSSDYQIKYPFNGDEYNIKYT